MIPRKCSRHLQNCQILFIKYCEVIGQHHTVYSRYKGPVRNIFEPIDSPGYNGQYSTGIHNSPIAGKSVKDHKIVIYFKKYTHFIRQCAEVKTNVGDTITPEQK